jgi:hypothetical protein
MSEKTNKEHLPGITINNDLPDLSKDPFFAKKAERARAFIAKYGLPEDETPAKKDQ